jgi:hypothetical protein
VRAWKNRRKTDDDDDDDDDLKLVTVPRVTLITRVCTSCLKKKTVCLSLLFFLSFALQNTVVMLTELVCFRCVK